MCGVLFVYSVLYSSIELHFKWLVMRTCLLLGGSRVIMSCAVMYCEIHSIHAKLVTVEIEAKHSDGSN